MSTEENIALVLRFHEVSESGQFSELETLLAPNFQMNALGSLQPLTAEQGMQMGRMFINAFPDGRSTIEEQIVQGDRVATRGTYRGTHQGDFMGMPATGKRIEVPWLSMDKIAGGKLVEHRFLMDTQVMMQQLGVASPPR